MTAAHFSWSDILGALEAFSVVQKVFLALPFLGLAGWLSYRERRWRFSAKRTKAFRQLLKNDNWQRASVLDLQFALHDAFGRGLEPAELAFIATRSRAVALLNDRIEAGGNVRFKDDFTGWELPTRSVKNQKRLARGLIVLGFLGGGLALFAGAFILVAPNAATLLAFAYFVFFSLMGFGLASQFDASIRVVTLERYPEARPIPRHLETKHTPSLRKNGEELKARAR
jgi:hypothetical protein